jgi:hypothetical protein
LSLDQICGHTTTLDATMLATRLEILPSAELLSLLAQVVNKRLTNFTWNAAKEGFFFRGATLYYYDDHHKIPHVIDPERLIEIHQNVGQNNGNVTGAVVHLAAL